VDLVQLVLHPTEQVAAITLCEEQPVPPFLIPKVREMVLPDVGPVSVPIGEPIAHLKCFEAVALKDKQIEAGVWECSPGIWRRQVRQAELCHFVSGYAFFTPEGGDKFEIKAGDAVFFPPGSQGVWDVRETIRKSYVTFNY
jgi:uncharacterized cupin superfamily protein